MYWRYGLLYFGNTVNGIRISCSALFISILYRRNGAVMCMKFILRNSRNPSKHFNYYNDFKWRQSRESIKLLSQRCLSRSEQHGICNCVSGLLFKGGGFIWWFRLMFLEAFICWDKTVMAMLTSHVIARSQPWKPRIDIFNAAKHVSHLKTKQGGVLREGNLLSRTNYCKNRIFN